MFKEMKRKTQKHWVIVKYATTHNHPQSPTAIRNHPQPSTTTHNDPQLPINIHNHLQPSKNYTKKPKLLMLILKQMLTLIMI